MSTDTSGKMTAARLSRDLYIRQSTLYQVANNTESTTRQYDLRGRAVALGWPADRIHVTDIDRGHSGASSADREGFQHLVAPVSLGRAGIIAWNALGWPAPTPTGAGCCRSAPTATPSSWTRTGYMTRPASTTGPSWGKKMTCIRPVP